MNKTYVEFPTTEGKLARFDYLSAQSLIGYWYEFGEVSDLIADLPRYAENLVEIPIDRNLIINEDVEVTQGVFTCDDNTIYYTKNGNPYLVIGTEIAILTYESISDMLNIPELYEKYYSVYSHLFDCLKECKVSERFYLKHQLLHEANTHISEMTPVTKFEYTVAIKEYNKYLEYNYGDSLLKKAITVRDGETRIGELYENIDESIIGMYVGYPEHNHYLSIETPKNIEEIKTETVSALKTLIELADNSNLNREFRGNLLKLVGTQAEEMGLEKEVELDRLVEEYSLCENCYSFAKTSYWEESRSGWGNPNYKTEDFCKVTCSDCGYKSSYRCG